MIGVVVISENRESHEMLKTVRRLLGRNACMVPLTLKPGTSLAKMKKDLRLTLEDLSRCEGVLLLTNCYGSTQCNVCMPFVKRGSVEILTGFNLPMLIKLGTIMKSMQLSKLVPFIEKYGKQHIYRVKELCEHPD